MAYELGQVIYDDGHVAATVALAEDNSIGIDVDSTRSLYVHDVAGVRAMRDALTTFLIMVGAE